MMHKQLARSGGNTIASYIMWARLTAEGCIEDIECSFGGVGKSSVIQGRETREKLIGRLGGV